MNDTIDVLIADDNGRIRQHIRTLLETAKDVRVVGEANNGAEAIEKSKRLRPKIILMDITMPEVDGFQAAEKIQALPISAYVIFLSIHTNNYFVRRALEVGAQGYVLKQEAVKELLPAIRAVEQGQLYLSDSLKV